MDAVAAKRVVCLLAAGVVTAERVGPDEVFLILDAQILGCIIQHAHVLLVKSLALFGIRHLPALELNVLEVVVALVAPLILHPGDGALTRFGVLTDDLCDGCGVAVLHDLTCLCIELQQVCAHLLAQRDKAVEAVVLLEL